MHVLYCGDAGMCDGILLSVLSLCKHCDRPLHVYVLTAGIGERRAIPAAFASRLADVLREKHAQSTACVLDITDRFLREPPTANMHTRFTPLCMLRLYADTLAELPDKLLYLDADVLACADCGALWDTDIHGAEVAGVPDRYGKWFFGNILRHDYLNSGVLLLNMARICESGLFARCRALCREKKMFMPDQSALNKLAVKQKLPRRCNEQAMPRTDTVLKHFTTYFRFFPRFRAVTVKPWETERVQNDLGIHRFDDIFAEFQRRTTHAN